MARTGADSDNVPQPGAPTSVTESRVSIALATWNGAPFLQAQLDSFATQERLPDELVVCDDDSTDGTVELLHTFAEHAPFEVRIERNPSRLQTTANFERAVSLCSGDLIFLSDQDDVWHPAKIRTLAGQLETRPELGAVFCNGVVAEADLTPTGTDLWGAMWFSAAEQRRVRAGRGFEVLVRHSVASGNTLAFRSAYRDLYLPLPALRDCHDLWIALIVTAVSELAIVDEPLITYRVHSGNVFGVHEFSLREQLDQARKQLTVGAFEHSVALYSAVRERLRNGRVRDADRVTALLDEKVAHSERREAMSAGFLRRLPQVLGEAVTGRYGRLSYGWKSLAQDLFLR